MTTGLTRRDLDGLRFVADQKTVPYDLLAQFFAPNYHPPLHLPPEAHQEKQRTRGGDRTHTPWPLDARARIHAVSRIIDKWWQMRLVCKERPHIDQPMWVWVTAAGLSRLGLNYRDAHFYGEEELRHLRAITQIRLKLGSPPDDRNTSWVHHTWISERAIKTGYPQNSAGMVLPHLPDGAMELDEDTLVKMERGEPLPFKQGDRIAVEVELSRKDFARLETILADLLAHYQGVWYFCEQKAYTAIITAKKRLVEADVLFLPRSKRN